MNNPLTDLEHQVIAAMPGVSIRRARMAAPERVDALDVHLGDRVVAVLWTIDDGFCIADVNDDSVLDDSPDFVVHSVDEALRRLTILLGAARSADAGGADIAPADGGPTGDP